MNFVDINLLDVHINIFEGPLDLLLYLIKKNNVDIYDIPISQITQQYLNYLEMMKELNLNVAGEFLVMASTLIQIKAKSLLPKKDDELEDGQDPREGLVRMLEEYQKYKAATALLAERFNKYKDIFYRGSPVFEIHDKHLDVEMAYLIEAMKKAVMSLTLRREIEAEDIPIESRIEKILNILSQKKWIVLDELFKDETKIKGIVTTFLALLELVKQRKINVIQENLFEEVKVYLIEENSLNVN